MRQMLHKMQPRSKLRNTPYQSLEWQYLVQSDTGEAITSSDILGKFCDETDVHSDIDLNFLVGIPKIVRNKTADSSSDLSQNINLQLVDIKGYFMKEISRTKKEDKLPKITAGVNYFQKTTQKFYEDLKFRFYKNKNLLKLIKTQLQQKQIVNKKVLSRELIQILAMKLSWGTIVQTKGSFFFWQW